MDKETFINYFTDFNKPTDLVKNVRSLFFNKLDTSLVNNFVQMKSPEEVINDKVLNACCRAFHSKFTEEDLLDLDSVSTKLAVELNNEMKKYDTFALLSLDMLHCMEDQSVTPKEGLSPMKIVDPDTYELVDGYGKRGYMFKVRYTGILK